MAPWDLDNAPSLWQDRAIMVLNAKAVARERQAEEAQEQGRKGTV